MTAEDWVDVQIEKLGSRGAGPGSVKAGTCWFCNDRVIGGRGWEGVGLCEYHTSIRHEDVGKKKNRMQMLIKRLQQTGKWKRIKGPEI